MSRESTMRVELIRYTPDPEMLAGEAAALCYNGKNPERSLKHAMGNGHESVAEHASFTFLIEGVSRTLLAQITRHRLASFSVQSQRYVSYESGFGYIIPPKIKALGEEAVAEFERQMDVMHEWYIRWRDKLGTDESGNEDARFVLPGACETRLMVTMNVRELRHFFSLRCCNRAQWEIRTMALEMLRLCKETAPMLFANAGPGCVRGDCPEGARSCKKTKKT